MLYWCDSDTRRFGVLMSEWVWFMHFLYRQRVILSHQYKFEGFCDKKN